jgi:dCTP deaminase
MSIKNDKWIRHMSLEHDMIVPFVGDLHGKDVISYGPSSFGYDMRAGLDWKIFTDVLGSVVDPKRQDLRAFHNLTVAEGEAVVIPPNSYALTHSVEYVKIPRDVTAICVGKSTYARCGIHVNVTPLEAGWEGQVTIEISNGTRLPVKVYAGEGIMQVLFFQGDPPEVSYKDRNGKYQNQTGITLARILKDQ